MNDSPYDPRRTTNRPPIYTPTLGEDFRTCVRALAVLTREDFLQVYSTGSGVSRNAQIVTKAWADFTRSPFQFCDTAKPELIEALVDAGLRIILIDKGRTEGRLQRDVIAHARETIAKALIDVEGVANAPADVDGWDLKLAAARLNGLLAIFDMRRST